MTLSKCLSPTCWQEIRDVCEVIILKLCYKVNTLKGLLCSWVNCHPQGTSCKSSSLKVRVNFHARRMEKKYVWRRGEGMPV